MRLRVDTLSDGTAVELFVQVLGNPSGVPVVYLHGGPGDSSSPVAASVFDLNDYRVILYDQRGCGKSTPANHLEKNETSYLLADLEKIRREVNGGGKWVVAGGSWGTALALLYAAQYPSHVLGLILRGVFDLTPGHPEYKKFPEIAEKLEELVGTPTTDPGFPSKTLRTLLQTPRLQRTRKQLVRLLNDDRPLFVASRPPRKKPSFKELETMAILGAHYESNRFFQPFDIYANLAQLRSIPILMVQGKYDYICPPSMAKKIKARLPHAQLRLVPGGHALTDPPIYRGLVKASRDMLKLLK